MPVDARLLPLLQSIGAEGSLAAAARRLSLPYRTAWAVLESAARVAGTPLASLAPGRGAQLTPIGQRLLDAHTATTSLLIAHTEPIEIKGVRTTTAPTPSRLKIAASHDIALAQLKDRWRLAHDIALEFHGSVEAIEAYRAGRADVAGFHVAMTGRGETDPLYAMLDPRRDALVSFLMRTQGLIVARGNPRRIRRLADLAATGSTIVNRQPGSGTRLLFDRLLDRARLGRDRIAGYANEEFTHAAVAATVAAGRADAAFGIEAAAAQFGLHFVRLARERYRFVCSVRALDALRIVAFRRLLSSTATRAVVRPLPGYALDRPGSMVTLHQRRRPKNGYRGSV
ncbi:MAG TPA: substrate-binding domain-containing protein [Casimicrobiaceae bacterium]|nr:substrate-binding domain-containing protein [Casimicrobiaceae bacterium]